MSRKVHLNVDGFTLCGKFGLSATVVTILDRQVTCKLCADALARINDLTSGQYER